MKTLFDCFQIIFQNRIEDIMAVLFVNLLKSMTKRLFFALFYPYKDMKNNFWIHFFCFLFLVSCNQPNEIGKISGVNHYEELKENDIKLQTPKPSEWRYEHNTDKLETFSDYYAKKVVKPSVKRHTIYILPIGKFGTNDIELLHDTEEYLQLFFNLKVKELPNGNEKSIPQKSIRRLENRMQYNASDIINDILPNKLPQDGIVILGITPVDIYPGGNWNFVFGLASYSKFTAVISLNRLKDITVNNNTKCLERLLKISSHEIGHMFSVSHCLNAQCLMNGVNSISEVDTKPNVLCTECLCKLSWNLKFDNSYRMQKLIAFLKNHQLENDAKLLQNQLKIINQ